jgi:hypothetical protein
MKVILLLAFRFLLSALVVSCGSPPSTEKTRAAIIQNNTALGAIVTPQNPSRAERFAAEELQSYLQKMTGVWVPILQGEVPVTGSAIVVGRHPESTKLAEELRSHSTDQEAFGVIGTGNRLYLIGNGESAILYAAWDWLESLGVRWIFPIPEVGEYVPHRESVVLPNARKWEAPAMSFRGPSLAMPSGPGYPEDAHLSIRGVQASALFSYRLRLNNNVAFDPADSWVSVGSGHSYAYYLPPSRYFKDHPEWFSMINGHRSDGPGWQICFTNPDAAKEFAKNLLAEVRRLLERGVKIERMRLLVSPNDGVAQCDCPECAKLIDSEGSASSLVVYFANRVAEEVHKVFPTARIVFYAYSNYARPPEHAKPGKNVCPELTFWPASNSMAANFAKPMFSSANERFWTYFREWAKISDALSIYQYYGHYNWFTPWPQITQMTYDFPRLAQEPKLYGFYSENHPHWGTQAPNFYLQAKLMWNPKLDVHKALNEYYQAGFGPAAPYIQSYFEALQKRMDAIPSISGELVEIPSLLTAQLIPECNEFINKAEAAMSRMADQNMRARTQLVIQAWRQSVKAGEALRHFVKPTEAIGSSQRILADLNTVIQYARTPEGLWTFENRVVEAALRPLLETLQIPLENLPAGDFSYRDYLPYGGALKFKAKAEGFQEGRWGFVLPSYGQGTISLPLRAEEGRRITKLSVTLGWGETNTAKLDALLSLLTSDGTVIPLASDVRSASRTFSLPETALGQAITLRITCRNLTEQTLTILTNLHLQIHVE